MSFSLPLVLHIVTVLNFLAPRFVLNATDFKMFKDVVFGFYHDLKKLERVCIKLKNCPPLQEI
jgi:hypothetical protein